MKDSDEDYSDPVLLALELACKDLALASNPSFDESLVSPALLALELACRNLVIVKGGNFDESTVMAYMSKYLLDAVNGIARKMHEERSFSQ